MGASMTRAEVCQMLYNAGVTNLKPQSQANGGVSLDFRFLRDNKVYSCRPVGTPIVGPYPIIHYCDGYNPSLSANGDSIYKVYNAKLNEYVDICQQEWPTHPEFWGN